MDGRLDSRNSPKVRWFPKRESVFERVFGKVTLNVSVLGEHGKEGTLSGTPGWHSRRATEKGRSVGRFDDLENKWVILPSAELLSLTLLLFQQIY